MPLQIVGPPADALKVLLQDPTTGFNARLAAFAAEFDFPAMSIDWGGDSTTFLEAAVARDSQDVDYVNLFPNPLALVMYFLNAQNQGRQMFTQFSGPLGMALDFYLRVRFREGGSLQPSDLRRVEKIIGSVHEAAVYAIGKDASFGNVTYNRDYVLDRSNLLIFSDGFMQRASIDVSFEVTAL